LTYEDQIFISQVVQALESILASEKSLKNVRQKLRKAKENKELFEIFFKTFSYNPVSTLTLCYLSEQYELAYNIIISFTPKFITTSLLTKLCKLINLL
jgi:vacuole morphology and inheritance protein 14